MSKKGLSLKHVVLPLAVAGTLCMTSCQEQTGKELSRDLQGIHTHGRSTLEKALEKTYNNKYMKMNQAIQEAYAFDIENQGQIDENLLSDETRFILSLIENNFIDCTTLKNLSQAHDMVGIANIIYSPPNTDIKTLPPQVQQRNLNAFENAFNLAAMGYPTTELTAGIAAIREQE